MQRWRQLFTRRKDPLQQRLERIPADSLQGMEAYLICPKEAFARGRFGKENKAVRDERCGYTFLLDTSVAAEKPEIRGQQPSFERNETHLYWKRGSDACISVSTMKAPSVRTSSLRGWVEHNDRLGQMFGQMTLFLNLPSPQSGAQYRRVQMIDLGECPAYGKLHGFEETHAYCHVYYLDDKLYRKFILCARRDDTAWKVECTLPARREPLLPADEALPGQTFGSFFPLDP